MQSKRILILNGPNLGRLGKREPEVYGKTSLRDIESMLKSAASELGVSIECFQSNHEGALIDRIEQAADQGFSGCVFNPGAFTHTSIALHDAIKGNGIPTVEVHISNIYTREAFREHSVTAKASIGVISGLGIDGYRLALEHLVRTLV